MSRILATMKVDDDGTLRVVSPSGLAGDECRVELEVWSAEDEARRRVALDRLLAKPPISVGPWPEGLVINRALLYGSDRV